MDKLTDMNLLIILVPIIGTVIVNIIIALKTNNKIADVSAKADVITGHVNSAASASVTKINEMSKEISSLKEVLADDKIRAALLAQTAAVAKVINITESPLKK